MRTFTKAMPTAERELSDEELDHVTGAGAKPVNGSSGNPGLCGADWPPPPYMS